MNHFLKNLNSPRTDSTIQDRSQIRSRTGKPFSTPTTSDRSGSLAAGLFRRLLAKCGDPPLRVVLPDGQEILPVDDRARGHPANQ